MVKICKCKFFAFIVHNNYIIRFPSFLDTISDVSVANLLPSSESLYTMLHFVYYFVVAFNNNFSVYFTTLSCISYYFSLLRNFAFLIVH